jgi:phospholipid-binding lipoprotein MlaA
MKEPVVVINDVLQGEFNRAGISLGRFAVNSTIGIGGLLDVAAKWKLDKQTGDFGQTMYVWGLPEGPYLIVPLLGPSNPRDLTGMGVDAYMDPFSFLATVKNIDEIQISRFVLDGIDQRARVMDVLDDLQKNSLDFYAQLRSLSQQRRASELRRGAAPQPSTDFYQDPGNDSGKPPTAVPPTPPSPSNKPANHPPKPVSYEIKTSPSWRVSSSP